MTIIVFIIDEMRLLKNSSEKAVIRGSQRASKQASQQATSQTMDKKFALAGDKLPFFRSAWSHHVLLGERLPSVQTRRPPSP